jgi:ribosomal protein L22
VDGLRNPVTAKAVTRQIIALRHLHPGDVTNQYKQRMAPAQLGFYAENPELHRKGMQPMLPAANTASFSQSSEAPAQSEENTLQALAQQAMAEYLTPQLTEAIYELLQGESAQVTAQAPQATGTMSEFLRQAEAAKSNQTISPQEFQLIHAHIEKWHSLEKRQQFLEATFDRAKQSPCLVGNRLVGDSRIMNSLKKSEQEIVENFKDMQRSMLDGTISQYLIAKSPDIDKKLSRIEQNQENFGYNLYEVKKWIQHDEAERYKKLNATIKLGTEHAGMLGALIQDIEQQCAEESQPENLAALTTTRAHLQRQHSREITHIGRRQVELQRLQMPWPEIPPELCLNASVEAQPGPSTKAQTTAQPSLARER